MTEEMRKRLEEAADKKLNCANCLARKYGECQAVHKCKSYRSFLTGAELGYKEAIEQAKEWLRNHLGEGNGTPHFIKAFESDMNKFWEESK